MNTHTSHLHSHSATSTATCATACATSRTTPSGRKPAIKVQVRFAEPLVCAGLRAALEDSPEFELLPSPPRDGGGIERAMGNTASSAHARATIVVTDYEQGLALIANAGPQARQKSNQTQGAAPQVLIVTPRENEWDIRHALELGVRGYISLGCELAEVAEAVRALDTGLRHIGQRAARRLADSVACTALTSRETDVLRLVALGHCNKVVAHELDIAVGTVKSHLKTIFEKLGAKSRTEVAMVAQQRGLLSPAFSMPSLVPAAMPVTPPAQPLHMRHRALPRYGALMN